MIGSGVRISIHQIILAKFRFETVYVAQIPGLPGAHVSECTTGQFSNSLGLQTPSPANPIPLPPDHTPLHSLSSTHKGLSQRGEKQQLGCVTLGSLLPLCFLLHRGGDWISDSLRHLPALTGSEPVLTDVS